MNNNKVRKKTINDFNNQWKLQGELNSDYWASDEILVDQFSGIFSLKEIENKIICDVGAGTGRVIKNLLKSNPKKIFAVEPSDVGIDKITKKFKNYSNLKIIQSDGLNFKTDEQCDIAFSLGVIHHIKNPLDILINIRKNLKKNGRIVIWVYGYENNLPYILIYKFLSILTKRLPDKSLYLFSNLLNALIQPYIILCKFLNLPLKKYFINVFNKCGWKKRNDIIFDQLNPAYSKYYKKEEIEKVLTDAGFVNLVSFHRHNYSWTVVGENA